MEQNEKEQTLMNQVGIIKQSGDSEIVFSVGERTSGKFADIRKFIKNERYSGPTKSGIRMAQRSLEQLIKVLESIDTDPSKIQDNEIGRISDKSPSTDLVVRTVVYKGDLMVDIREWARSVDYEGWTKRGIRFDINNYKEFLTYTKNSLEVIKHS